MSPPFLVLVHVDEDEPSVLTVLVCVDEAESSVLTVFVHVDEDKFPVLTVFIHVDEDEPSVLTVFIHVDEDEPSVLTVLVLVDEDESSVPQPCLVLCLPSFIDLILGMFPSLNSVFGKAQITRWKQVFLLPEVDCYYSGKKAMIDMSVHQPLSFFKWINIIVDGYKIKKRPFQFET